MFCLNMGIVFGQQIAPQPLFKHEKLSLFKFLNNKLSEASQGVLKDSCMSSTAFAKFSIDSSGELLMYIIQNILMKQSYLF